MKINLVNFILLENLHISEPKEPFTNPASRFPWRSIHQSRRSINRCRYSVWLNCRRRLGSRSIYKELTRENSESGKPFTESAFSFLWQSISRLWRSMNRSEYLDPIKEGDFLHDLPPDDHWEKLSSPKSRSESHFPVFSDDRYFDLEDRRSNRSNCSVRLNEHRWLFARSIYSSLSRNDVYRLCRAEIPSEKKKGRARHRGRLQIASYYARRRISSGLFPGSKDIILINYRVERSSKNPSSYFRANSQQN